MQKTVTEEAKPQLPRLDKSYTVLHEQWGNLHFTDRGASRLHHMAGFILGAKACGKDDVAEGLAADLCQQLDWLNRYGGDAEFAMEDGGTLTCPAYRVILSDDGTFGGFGVLWHSVVHPEKVREAKQAMPWGDEPHKEWMKRLSEAHQWRTELELWRCYKTSSDQMERAYVQYRYSFNGGLLFQGFGFDPTAVVIGKCKYWSIHT